MTINHVSPLQASKLFNCHKSRATHVPGRNGASYMAPKKRTHPQGPSFMEQIMNCKAFSSRLARPNHKLDNRTLTPRKGCKTKDAKTGQLVEVARHSRNARKISHRPGRPVRRMVPKNQSGSMIQIKSPKSDSAIGFSGTVIQSRI